MDEQSLPRLMAEIMVGCQSGNKLICYNKLRQGAKWIMVHDPPPDDGPSQMTVEMNEPSYETSEIAQVPPGRGWHPEMAAYAGHGYDSPSPSHGWEPEIRSGSACVSLSLLHLLEDV